MNEAENKVKEYIDRAIELEKTYRDRYVGTDILVIAQMLQKEDHFNNKNS